MRTTFYFAAVTALSLGIVGCTSTTHSHEPSPLVLAESQTIDLPRDAGSGAGREVTVHLDEPHLKLVTIALRNGTPLSTHTADVPVTIQVLEGEGVIHVGSKPISVVPGSFLWLVAGEEHDVITKEGEDILLLVHYLRVAG